jgi:hypothetical protein
VAELNMENVSVNRAISLACLRNVTRKLASIKNKNVTRFSCVLFYGRVNISEYIASNVRMNNELKRIRKEAAFA